MTMMFLVIIMGATDKRVPQGFAPIAIGLGLTQIHLISIPVTQTSVDPARSAAVAVFAGDWAMSQFRLFWIAPILGEILGGVLYRSLGKGGEWQLGQDCRMVRAGVSPYGRSEHQGSAAGQ